jgi:hypothetical protein
MERRERISIKGPSGTWGRNPPATASVSAFSISRRAVVAVCGAASFRPPAVGWGGVECGLRMSGEDDGQTNVSRVCG